MTDSNIELIEDEKIVINILKDHFYKHTQPYLSKKNTKMHYQFYRSSAQSLNDIKNSFPKTIALLLINRINLDDIIDILKYPHVDQNTYLHYKNQLVIETVKNEFRNFTSFKRSTI